MAWAGSHRYLKSGPRRITPVSVRRDPRRTARRCGSREACEGILTMAKQPAGAFAELLQRLRISAGMTQDELAKAAEVSPRTVSDLERGINRTARKDTAELLATAMGLTGHEREQFLAAARGRPATAGRAGRAGAA